MDTYEDHGAYLAKREQQARQRTTYWKRELIDTEIELGGSPDVKRTRKRDAQAVYLAFLEFTNGKSMACEATQISASRVKNWEATDVIFSKVVPAVYQAAIERLVSEASRRAVDGVEEVILHQGKVVAYKRKYSDALMQTLLKGLDQARFGDGSGASAANSEASARREAAKMILGSSEEALAAFEVAAELLQRKMGS